MKPTTTRIVCGTDFSPYAAEAATVAGLLASRLDESLVLTHVIQHVSASPASRESNHLAVSECQKKLHQEAERIRKLGVAVVKEDLLTGSPNEKLVEAGNLSSTRLLVLSSLGKIAPSRFFLGSVAERTAEHSAAPTLVVRGASAFEAWLRGERPLKVVVCYDFSESAISALSWINELRKIGPCDVTVVYVSWPPQEIKRLGIHGKLSLDENSPRIQAILERDIEQKVSEVLGRDNVHTRVLSSWGRPDFPLLGVASEVKADLVVVGTHQRHGLGHCWLGSVSRAVLRHSPTSVAVVPQLGAATQGPAHIPEFKRALVTTDFSDLANRAIPYAYSVLPRGGQVCLLHVAAESETGAEKSLKGEVLRRELQHLIPSEAEARGIETQIEVVDNEEASTAICQAAERFGADLICMASHGRSGLAKTVLGSVAQSVMTQSTRPLLVLRATAP